MKRRNRKSIFIYLPIKMKIYFFHSNSLLSLLIRLFTWYYTHCSFEIYWDVYESYFSIIELIKYKLWMKNNYWVIKVNKWVSNYNYKKYLEYEINIDDSKKLIIYKRLMSKLYYPYDLRWAIWIVKYEPNWTGFFCSELIAYCLDLDFTQISPTDLKLYLDWKWQKKLLK